MVRRLLEIQECFLKLSSVFPEKLDLKVFSLIKKCRNQIQIPDIILW